MRNNAWRSAAATSDDWSRALNIPNLSRVVKYNQPRMPWPEVVALLQKYTRLEKQGDTGLYHVARIKQWLSYLRKEYDEATGLFQHVRVSNNPLILQGGFRQSISRTLKNHSDVFYNVLALYQ
ncbi:hypothetical protein ACNKHT_13975 [Shigella flexneri]